MGMDMGHLGLRHALGRLRGTRRVRARQRARLQDELAAKVAAFEARIALLDQELAATDEEINVLSAALTSVYADTPDAIAPRQTFPKKHLSSWGGLTRTILDVLRSENGGPLPAGEIAAKVKNHLNLCIEGPVASRGFRRQVGRALQNMHHAGYLEGLHDPKAVKEGIWRLKASPE